MVTWADFVPSALLVAVTTAEPAVVEERLAVVRVTALSVPPVTDQVTPALPISLVTVAVNARDCEVVMPPRRGEIETEMGGGAPRVVAEAVLEGWLVLLAASFAVTR